MKKPTPVIFLYRHSLKRHGSTQMRCLQMNEIMKRYGSERFSYKALPVPKLPILGMYEIWVRTLPREAIFIFVKDVIDRLSVSALSLIHKRSIAIMHDPVDREISKTPKNFVDIHIASSITQKRYIDEILRVNGSRSKVEILLHQADLRLPPTMDSPQKSLKSIYFGEMQNCLMMPELERFIEVVAVKSNVDFLNKMDRLPNANFHYAVRPPEQATSHEVIKPLTKASVAAKYHSPIMINRAAHDAEELLGVDYPYFVDAMDPGAILTKLREVEMDFGGPKWMEAVSVMKSLDALVSPMNTARNLNAILGSVL